jgi:curli production assembly/transport component CsgF
MAMKTLSIIILLLGAVAMRVQSQELVFNFSNPSFLRGNSFNASWMLQEAQLQNQFTVPSKDYSNYETDPLLDFSENLNRQILGQLSRQLYSKTFGEDGIKEGQYDIGDYSISITEEANGVVIEIRDVTNGNETRVVVPYF